MKKVIAFTASMIISAGSQAVECTGVVSKIGVGVDGHVVVSGPGGLNSVFICNINGITNGVTVDLCKSMYSGLLTSYATGSPTIISFTNNTACSAFQPWQYAQNIGWVIQQK